VNSDHQESDGNLICKNIQHVFHQKYIKMSSLINMENAIIVRQLQDYFYDKKAVLTATDDNLSIIIKE
jgi:hypothetical protein